MSSAQRGPEDIKDEDELYRRIHPTHVINGKISSAAFKQRAPDLSVDIARLTTPERALLNYPNYGLGSLVAGFFRNLKLEVYHAPIPCNYAHAIVYGKITPSMAKMIAIAVKLVRRPMIKL